MSEKRYIIVSPSHHKKPRAMFLKRTNKKDVWLNFVSGEISSFVLEHALEIAKLTPIGVYLVQSNGFFLEYYNEGDMPKFANFISFMQGKDCEVICDWRQTQARETSEPRETPEEKREYMLYRYLSEGSDAKQFYYSYNSKDCYSKNVQSATLHTEDEAMLQVNKLAKAGSKGWFCVHRDTFNADGSFKEAEQETPAPAPEAKKRVGYVLFHSTERKEKIYAHYESNGVFVRVAGIVADAYRTRGDAQFAADVLNNNGDTNFGWQVEQIEF